MLVEICPKCKEGHLEWGTFDTFCSDWENCGYREPHIHDIKIHERSDGIFGMGFAPSAVNNKFMCTCINWDTLKEHERRRQCLTSLP